MKRCNRCVKANVRGVCTAPDIAAAMQLGSRNCLVDASSMITHLSIHISRFWFQCSAVIALATRIVSSPAPAGPYQMTKEQPEQAVWQLQSKETSINDATTRVRENVFFVFFEKPKNVTFYVFFVLLHTFSRTMTTTIVSYMNFSA